MHTPGADRTDYESFNLDQLPGNALLAVPAHEKLPAASGTPIVAIWQYFV